MYSLVLMSALTTTPNTAEFNGFFADLFNSGNCSGCSGCCGGGAIRYSCYGGCSGSTDSYACSGCSGCCGGSGLFSGERFRSFFSLFGCNGCCGGSGRSYGCCGSASYSCNGCCGSASYSCFGGPAVSYAPTFSGGFSCNGGPAPIFEPYPYPATPTPTIPYAAPQSAPTFGPMVVPDRQGLRPAGSSGPAGTVVAAGAGGRATVVVRLPSDARLYADGAPLRLAGGERKFVTPELPAGMEYSYRFTAEYERGGETVSVTKKVAVRAGSSATIEFSDLTASRPSSGGADAPAAPASRSSEGSGAAPVSNPNPGSGAAPVVPSVRPTGIDPPRSLLASAPPALPMDTPVMARATITVTMPAGAVLYVDDRRSPSMEPIRRFTTPPLPVGREFAYLLKAEVVRGGQPEQLIQKIAFRAGEQVVVDFTTLGTGR
jgi:uncharacterized protein (TIGR03000 family)